MKKNTKKKLSSEELAAFCAQIASVLKAGISPGEGIAIMLEDTSSLQEQEILTAIQETLNATGVFSLGLEDAKVFPEYMQNMVRLGEQAGRLDEVMDALAGHYQREADLSAALKSALTYPCIMIGMMVLVVLVLVTRVLPVFQQVYAQLGQTMTGFSRGLLDMGQAINRYSLVLLALLVLLVLVCLYFSRTSSGQKRASLLFSRLPFTRNFIRQKASLRFASGMALALKSGLTPEEGMDLAGVLTGSSDFMEQIVQCKKLMEEGTPLARALSVSGIFTGMEARLLTVGDRTGSIDEAMEKIASRCQEELDVSMENAVSIIEPTLVAVLSVIVGLILLSVMMPLMGILSGL